MSPTARETAGIAVATILGAFGSVPALADLSGDQIYSQSIDSVCTIVSFLNRKPLGLGSGFIVSTDGLIVTNWHVIKGATELHVKCGHLEAQTLAPQRLYGDTDLAVIETGWRSTKPLRISDDNPDKQVGKQVFVIGNPEGLQGSISSGLISAIRNLAGDKYLQISAPISQGSSGGPVILANGSVIGIATAVLQEGQNLNFALSAARLMDIPAIALKIESARETAGAGAPKPSGDGPVEVGEIVKAFMVPKGHGSAVYWDIGLSQGLPFEWMTDGFETQPRGLVRTARIRAVAAGKKMFVLRREPEELFWLVDVVGSKFGINNVDIAPDPDCFGVGNSGCEYDFEASLKIAGVKASEICSFHHFDEYVVYDLSFPGKRDITALVVNTCGSGGCSTLISLHYVGDETTGALPKAQCRSFVSRETDNTPDYLVVGRR